MKDKTLKEKFIRYAVTKVNFEDAEKALLNELKKQLKENKINIPNLSASSLTKLSLVDDGVQFDYRVINYDESEPASILLK